MYHDRTAWCCAVFVGKKIWQQRISTKKCCPCTMNIACHVKQSSKTTSFGGTLSWRWRGWKSSAHVVPRATTRILRRRFPGTCEMVGQVFKFVWRLHWKINAVCMSLSPFVSFQSRFVTYLLTYPPNWYVRATYCILLPLNLGNLNVAQCMIIRYLYYSHVKWVFLLALSIDCST